MSQFSDWLKIDLHIHTDFSKKTKNNDYKGSFSIDKLHEKLTNENVEIFSLTDHNIINIEAYETYYRKYNKEKDPLLLVGVELDIEGTNKTYHSLLIFNSCNYNEAEIIHKKLENVYKEKRLDMLKRSLTFDDIISTFDGVDFFFIPHAGNNSSIIEGYKDDISLAQKMIILLQSPMEKVKEMRRQVYNDHFDKKLSEQFQNKEDFAYIEFSDNHYIEEYPCCHINPDKTHRFYYVKGSKNYETLRLAFIDPKSRIKSSSKHKDIIKPRDYVSSIEFSNNKLLKETRLKFSPYLNVIIGGRSSGKSLLMDILSRSIDTLQSNDKYNKILDDLPKKISSKNDSSFKNKTHIDTEILQINQGDIVNYFEDSKLENLAIKSGKFDEYKEKKKSFDSIKLDLNGKITDFISEYENIYNLDIEQSIGLQSSTIQKLMNTEYHLKLDKENLMTKIYKSEEFKKTIEEIDKISNDIKNIDNYKTIKLIDEDKEKIKNFIVLLSKIKEKQKVKMILHENLLNFIKGVEKEIDDSNSKLTIESQNKAEANKKIQNLIKQTGTKFSLLANLNKVVEDIKNLKIKHIEKIKLDEDSSLCIELVPEKSIESYILEGIKDNTKQNLYHTVLELLYKKARLKNYSVNNTDNFRKKINSQLDTLINKFESLKDYLEYSDGTSSKSNSPGFNSEKYLKVVLNNSRCGMAIIDQPEDNLGKKFISNELVDLIREIKFEKQLFLITHDPAIVVYGDAEAIVIAENNENEISYSQVKLEDVDAQRLICDTLDGGEYIFDNRSKKYNIQRLLQEEI